MNKTAKELQLHALLTICFLALSATLIHIRGYQLIHSYMGKARVDALLSGKQSITKYSLDNYFRSGTVNINQSIFDTLSLTSTDNTSVSQIYLPIITQSVLPKMLNSSFEYTNTVWGQFSTCCPKLIFEQSELTEIGVNPHTGTHLAWLGGNNNEESKISQNINLATDYTTLQLNFWYWIKSDDYCGNDRLTVKINSVDVYHIQLCRSFVTDRWIQDFVDVTPYIGNDILVEFVVQTNQSLSSHFLLDDVTIQP